MTSEIQKELENNVKEIKCLISKQKFRVGDAEKFLKRYNNFLLKLIDLEKSRDNWKLRYLELQDKFIIEHKKEVKKMAYKEINPTEWTYENDGDFIEGILVQKQSDVGINKSMLYSIETSEGVKNVWGATILDSRMSLINVGNKVKITYKGKTESRPGKNPAKVFKVEVDTDFT